MKLTDEQFVRAIDKCVSKVRTRSLDISFNELLDMYGSEELRIDPEYQRLFRWSDEAQSRFIESLILELPIPPVYLMEDKEGEYELIDGLQRISTYLRFRGQLPNKAALTLVGCDIVADLNGVTYEELPRAVKIKLKRNFVRAEVLRRETDPRLRYYMFKRLNTGGEHLADQEIRNCTVRLLSPEFNNFLIKMSRNDDFQACIDLASERLKRKYDQELALRFFAMKNERGMFRHSVRDFLTDYMERVTSGESEFDYEVEAEVFAWTFRLLRTAAMRGYDGPEFAFGSVDTRSRKVRGQFSAYQYEAVVVGLQALHGKDVDGLSGELLGKALLNFKLSPEFAKTLGGGKNDRVPAMKRIELAEAAFSELIG